MMNTIPVFLHTITPLYAHPHTVFAFLHLALCSRNSSYSIHHLFRLNSSLHIFVHLCTFSFITAHFVHHCTLKQALLIGNYSNRSTDLTIFGIWGLNPSLFMIWGLSPINPYVYRLEPPLHG